MHFEWDDDKAQVNATKHKVTFEEAVTLWTDPFALIASDPEHSTEEVREWIIGTSHLQKSACRCVHSAERKHLYYQRSKSNS